MCAHDELKALRNENTRLKAGYRQLQQTLDDRQAECSAYLAALSQEIDTDNARRRVTKGV